MNRSKYLLWRMQRLNTHGEDTWGRAQLFHVVQMSERLLAEWQTRVMFPNFKN